MKIAYTSNTYPFVLSLLGSKYYYSLRGINLFFYRRSQEKWKRIDSNKSLNYYKDHIEILFYTEDHGPVLPDNLINSADAWKSRFHLMPIRDDKRNDPRLIQTIEKLKEKASGKFCNIKIIEIPDNTEYEIVMNVDIIGESILGKCGCCNAFTKRFN